LLKTDGLRASFWGGTATINFTKRGEGAEVAARCSVLEEAPPHFRGMTGDSRASLKSASAKSLHALPPTVRVCLTTTVKILIEIVAIVTSGSLGRNRRQKEEGSLKMDYA